MCEQDMAARRARDLARYHRRTAARIAAGLCPKCGKQQPAPGRRLCEPCSEKSNHAARARDARLRAAGIPRRLRWLGKTAGWRMLKGILEGRLWVPATFNSSDSAAVHVRKST